MAELYAQYNGYVFVFITELEPPTVLLACPLELLSEDDTRQIHVISEPDIDTGEMLNTVIAPEVREGEEDMWANCIAAAGAYLAGQ